MAMLEVVGDMGRPDDWSGLVVFFGGTAWDGNRFPDQHVAERLTRWAPVLYVDPPLSVLRAVRAGGPRALRPRLERLDERLVRLTPVAPPAPQRTGMRSVTNDVVRRTARRAVRLLGGTPDVVVVASLSPWLYALPARLRILYGTDDFVAGAELMGVGVTWLRKREQDQLRRADLAIAVSDELARSWRAQGAVVEVVENGCDVDLFAGTDDAAPASDVALPSPIAGFIGHLSHRIDLALLEAVADGGHSLLLVGPRQSTFAADRIAELLARPNVQWIGARPFSALPGYLRQMDVGLVPYADTAFNRASSPLKTLEYLAAGRSAVVTGLPAMRRLPADVVCLADTPESFSRKVAEALSTPRDETAAARRRAVAAEHSWDARAADFAQLLGLTSALDSRR